MNTRPLDAPAQSTIEGYLAAIAARLSGPARLREAIVAELRDGLLEAVRARLVAGATPAQAATAAAGQFGDADTVAAWFAPELAGATARRAALALIGTGPLVGTLWATAYAASRFGPVRAAPPWRWPAAPTGAWLGFPLLGLAVAIAGVATLLALASTGRCSRWLPFGLGLAPVAAATVAVAAMIVDLTVLGLLAVQVLTQPWSLAWAPVALAVAASVARLVLAGRTTRRCRTTGASLT
jgi:hypothetical protein